MNKYRVIGRRLYPPNTAYAKSTFFAENFYAANDGLAFRKFEELSTAGGVTWVEYHFFRVTQGDEGVTLKIKEKTHS